MNFISKMVCCFFVSAKKRKDISEHTVLIKSRHFIFDNSSLYFHAYELNI